VKAEKRKISKIAAVLLVLLTARAGSGAATGLSREGRRLLWDGRPVRLVGFSYYGLVADRSFDFSSFLRILAAHNVTLTRFFVTLPWPVYPGPNLLPFAKVGKHYDLKRFDDRFFERLKRVVKEAEELGIICQVCIFDRCGLAAGDKRGWDNNPYNMRNNLNGLFSTRGRSYPLFCVTSGEGARIHAALMRKVVRTLGTCKNVIYEIMNEPVPELGPLAQWHKWAAGILKEELRGKLGSKLVSANGDYNDPNIDLFSMHRAGSEPHVRWALRRSQESGKPVILSDDGDMACMFNPRVTTIAAARALRAGQHFEHLAYTLTLQREEESRRADRLEDLPGLSFLNLRRLSRIAVPVINRPYVRDVRIAREQESLIWEARVKNGESVTEVSLCLSADGGRSWVPVRCIQTEGLLRARISLDPERRYLFQPAFLLRNGQQVVGSIGAWGPWRCAYLRMERSVKESGLIRIRANVPDGALKRAAYAGVSCYETDIRKRSRYAYFRFDTGAHPRGRPRNATVTLEIYDRPGGSQILLEYDGAGGPYTPCPPLKLEGSGTWKTIFFQLKEALFSGRQNDGADFRVSALPSGTPLALRAVTVLLPEPEYKSMQDS